MLKDEQLKLIIKESSSQYHMDFFRGTNFACQLSVEFPGDDPEVFFEIWGVDIFDVEKEIFRDKAKAIANILEI